MAATIAAKLAERIKELTRSHSEIVYIPYDEACEEGFEDMPRRVPDTTRVRELVGFEPRTDLDSILRRVIEYHSEA